jgi:hypothetical protein
MKFYKLNLNFYDPKVVLEDAYGCRFLKVENDPNDSSILLGGRIIECTHPLEYPPEFIVGKLMPFGSDLNLINKRMEEHYLYLGALLQCEISLMFCRLDTTIESSRNGLNAYAEAAFVGGPSLDMLHSRWEEAVLIKEYA